MGRKYGNEGFVVGYKIKNEKYVEFNLLRKKRKVKRYFCRKVLAKYLKR
jgi:hypothetical protein